ncbi:PP2C family protein-serine/threonine phosphatase [Nonomuraea pusilla]|uniref:PP2C family protein-serine/threonine phosphatase n=1 Tax=Nonomuraea pusilla TaxID=46177 RepID=UPI003318BC76
MRSQTALRRLPFAAMFTVALIDLLAGPSLGFLPLLTLGPTFASVSGSVRRTAAVGAVALAICLPLASYNGVLLRWQNNITVASIVSVTAAGMLASELRLRRERELANVRLVAEAAQRVLLRPVPRSAGDLRVALSYTSAAAEARIGGDLYEVVTTPHGVRLLIGDVQGKGLEAVETAAWVLGAFREAAYDEPGLAEVGDRLEASLARHLGGEKFVTAIVAEVHDDEILLLNCGHPAPLLISADGRAEPADPPEDGLPLGLLSLGSDRPEPYRVPFGEGDRILFFTDGVIEARDSAGTFYPLLERAPLLVAEDPQTALDALRADLIQHIRGPCSTTRRCCWCCAGPASDRAPHGETRTRRRGPSDEHPPGDDAAADLVPAPELEVLAGPEVVQRHRVMQDDRHDMVPVAGAQRLLVVGADRGREGPAVHLVPLAVASPDHQGLRAAGQRMRQAALLGRQECDQRSDLHVGCHRPTLPSGRFPHLPLPVRAATTRSVGGRRARGGPGARGSRPAARPSRGGAGG